MNDKLIFLIIILCTSLSHAQGCPSIIMPTSNQENVSTSTDITWTEIEDAVGYYVLIGTTLGGRDLVDRVDVGNSTEYIHDREYPANTLISVKITVRFNGKPDQTCPSITFITGNATPQRCNHFINSVADFQTCDLDGDSSEEFNIDLTQLESRLIGNQTRVNVTYHNPDGSLIDFSIGNQFVVNQRTIMARATDENGCIEETLFNLLLFPPPEVTTLEDVNVCEAYVLPNLNEISNYFTLSGGTGTALSGGDIISISQLIYIYAEVGECSDEHSFQVTIDPANCEEQPVEVPNVQFPKFFTPNGDGINDYWQYAPTESKIEVNIETLWVFDRFGNLMTQIDPKSKGWNGNFNGQPSPSSDYWFKAVTFNKSKIYGHFTLKR
jgi:gliding motility-associated-like protein